MKKTKTSHKILCTALSVVLVVGLMPSVAFADDWDDFWNWMFSDWDTPSYTHSNHGASSNESTANTGNTANENAAASNANAPAAQENTAVTNETTESNAADEAAAKADVTLYWNNELASEISATTVAAQTNLNNYYGAYAEGSDAAVAITFVDLDTNAVVDAPAAVGSYQETATCEDASLARTFSIVEQASGDDAAALDSAMTLECANLDKIDKQCDKNKDKDTCRTQHAWVNFNTMGGHPCVSAQKVTVGDTVCYPGEVCKTGYTFLYWSLCPNGAPFDFTTPICQNTTLYAVYEANTYTINFDPACDDAEGTMAPQEMTYDCCAHLTENAFSREGYAFEGWVDDCGNFYCDREKVKNLVKCDEGSITLHAVWKAADYKVIFDGNGAEDGWMWPQCMVYDKERALQLNKFTRTGYDFAGWNTEADGSGTAYADGETVVNLTSQSHDKVVLYAQWTAHEYSIEFIGNGSTSGAMASQAMTYDKEAALNANAFQRVGYAFVGWNTAADGSGTAYVDGQTVLNLTAEQGDVITLYAQWSANNYTVVFDKNASDAKGTMADQPMVRDQAATLSTNVYVRSGYTFTGWNTMADGTGTAYADRAEVMNLTADQDGKVVLYAQWTANEVSVSPVTGDSTMLIVGGVIVLAVVAAGVLFFLRRKEN